MIDKRANIREINSYAVNIKKYEPTYQGIDEEAYIEQAEKNMAADRKKAKTTDLKAIFVTIAFIVIAVFLTFLVLQWMLPHSYSYSYL